MARNKLILIVFSVFLFIIMVNMRHSLYFTNTNTDNRIINNIPVRALLINPLVDDAFKQIIPFSLPSPASGLSLVDITYCSIDNKPKLFAIVIPSLTDTLNFLPKKISDCNDSLFNQAQKAKLIYSQSPWVAAISINVDWQSWNLQLFIDAISVVGDTVSSQVKPSSLFNLKQQNTPFYSVSTKNMKLDIGKEKPITLDLILSFKKDIINIFGVPSSSAIDITKDTIGQSIKSTSIPQFTNSILQVDEQYLTELINLYFATTKVPVKLPDGTIDSLTVTDTRLICKENDLKISSIISRNNSSKKFNGNVNWGGDDLILTDILLSSIPNDCGPRPSRPSQLTKWLQCKAENTLLENFANSLSSNLKNKFQGLKLRPVKPSSPIKINYNNKVTGCSIVALKSHSHNSSFSAFLNVVLK